MSQGDGVNQRSSEATQSNQEMVAQIVSAFAQRSDVSVDDIVRLTKELTGTLRTAPAVADVAPPAVDPAPKLKAVPAVSIETSISNDAICCLVCGKSFKTLKRHLHAAHGMTEADYRTAYDLPEDYPLVAPSYSERRSQVASDFGFGTYDRTDRSGRDVA